MKSVTLEVRSTKREEILLITGLVERALGDAAAENGLCTIYTPHTTAAVAINENADPDVRMDLIAAFRAMVPDVRFRHGEGNSDAHLLSTLIGVSLTIPFRARRLLLGRWQGIYFVELDGPRRREISIHLT